VLAQEKRDSLGIGDCAQEILLHEKHQVLVRTPLLCYQCFEAGRLVRSGS
jgi:hypothetical protein